ncbi:MAG: hypothetical protein NVS2B16_22930 [Chloroflexota bacterium]
MHRSKAGLFAALSCAIVLAAPVVLRVTPVSAHNPPAKLQLVHPGFLTVGSDTTYPPMESRSANGKFVGADIDLANALAHAMGLKSAIIVETNFDSIIPAMTSRHAFDVIMSSMNHTPDRAKVIGFVDYMQASEGIVVKTASSIHANSYAGICGHTIAVESGTTEYSGLTSANKSCAKKITVKNFTHDNDAFQAFASGHAEAYTGDLPVAALYVKQHAGGLRLAGHPFGTGQKYGIGLAKNAGALHQAVASALQKVRANGQYRRILNHWGLAAAAL